MNLSQLDFGIFGLKLYGLCVGIAFFVASWHWYKLIQKERMAQGFFVHHFWRWLLGGILLGRLGALLATPEIFSVYGIFSFFAFWEAEIHFIGFFIGFLLVMFTDLKKHDKKPWRWIDLGVFPFLIIVMMLDVAGFLTGAIYGSETSLIWGIKYEAMGVKILSPVHPITLYGLIAHVGLWFAVKHYWTKWKKIPGKIATMTGICYFGLDFLLQFLRADETLILLKVVRLEQLLDLIVFVGLVFWYQKKYKS